MHEAPTPLTSRLAIICREGRSPWQAICSKAAWPRQIDPAAGHSVRPIRRRTAGHQVVARIPANLERTDIFPRRGVDPKPRPWALHRRLRRGLWRRLRWPLVQRTLGAGTTGPIDRMAGAVPHRVGMPSVGRRVGTETITHPLRQPSGGGDMQGRDEQMPTYYGACPGHVFLCREGEFCSVCCTHPGHR